MPESRSMISAACAFVDIMGQRNELKKFDQYRLGPELQDNREFAALVDKTIRRVDRLHRGFFEFFDTFRTHDSGVVPAEHREYWATITSIRPKLVPFSDGFYLSTPLTHDREVLPIFGIASLLHSLCMTMLTQLASGTAVRGGCEIGTEIALRDNVYYGSGLANTYALESGTAIYPRIVAGPAIRTYIHNMTAMSTEAARDVTHVTNPWLYAQLTSRLALLCESMLIIDFDGHAVVHYLSPYMLESMDDQTRRALIGPAQAFVVEQAAAARRTHDTHVGIKYSLLMQYFDEFAPVMR